MSRKTYTLYTHDISKYHRLSKPMERVLSEKIQRFNDSESLDLLVKANLRLVVHIAYEMYDQRCKLDFLDMISEGNIALMDAARTWDWRKDDKRSGFAAYASVFIRRRLLKQAYTSGRTVSFPTRVLADKRRVMQIKEKFEQTYQRYPTYEELALLSGLTEKAVKTISECDLPVVSLDIDKKEEEDERGICVSSSLSTLISTLESDSNDSASSGSEDIIRLFASNRTDRDRFLSVLSPIQLKVISYTYGLGGSVCLRSDEIAQRLGKTQRRINQIIQESLSLLRVHNAKLLQELTE